jgi:hypothetical protein
MQSRKSVTTLLVLCLFVAPTDDFYKELTTSFTRNSFYLCVTVENGGKKMDIVIENDDMYRWLLKANPKKTQAIYSDEMTKLLKGNATVAVDAATFQSLLGNKLDAESEKKFATLSRESIVKTYFSNRVLKKKLSPSDMNSLIHRLFTLKTLSKMDEELGYLIIKK